MADGLINYGIIRPELAGAFGTGYNEAEQERLKTQTEQTNLAAKQFQLDELKRDRAAMLQLQSQLQSAGKDPDLGKVADAFISSGRPDYVMQGMELRKRLQAQADYAAAQGLPMPKFSPPSTPAAAPAAVPTAGLVTPAPAPQNALGSGLYGTPTPGAPTANALAQAATAPAAAPVAPVNMLTPGTAAAPTGAVLRGEALAAQNQAKAADISDRITRLMTFASRYPGEPAAAQALQEAKILESQLSLFSKPAEPTPPLVAEYNLAKREGFAGSFFDFKKQLTEAGRPPAQPRPEQPPVAVIDPTTGKQVYVSREEALRGRMTPAAGQEGLAPKEIQKREANLPQATSSLKSFDANADSFVKDLESLRDHPGLTSITGLVYGRTPSVTASGRAAQALYDKVVAKGGFQMLQDMRNASKTGGALGNVSDREGAQLKSAFAAIDRTQDPQDVRRALTDAIEQIKASKDRMHEAYDSTYEYRQNKPGTTPKGGTSIRDQADAILGGR